MDFQGVVSDPYYKPEGPRLSQMLSESSEEDSDEVLSDRDIGASLETFANTYELELKDLIHDLNLELERVSVSCVDDEEDGEEGCDGARESQESQVDLRSEVVKVEFVCNGGSCVAVNGKDSVVCVEEEDDGGEEEEVCEIDRTVVCSQGSSDSDGDSAVVDDVAERRPESSSNSEELAESGLKQPCNHVGNDFDNFELRVRKAIRDLSCLTALMVGRESLFSTRHTLTLGEDLGMSTYKA